jgi:hypothetical protein
MPSLLSLKTALLPTAMPVDKVPTVHAVPTTIDLRLLSPTVQPLPITMEVADDVPTWHDCPRQIDPFDSELIEQLTPIATLLSLLNTMELANPRQVLW